MTSWAVWHCLPLETQEKLIKEGWKPEVKVIPLTSEVEDSEEISKLMRQSPKNVKRNGRW